MAALVTWLTITGIILLVLGFVLRTIAMMRSSDLTAAGGRVLHGRELLAQHRRLLPKSPMPLLARSAILGGALLLAAAIGIEIYR